MTDPVAADTQPDPVEPSGFSGWATMEDGTRRRLTSEEAEALWRKVEQEKTERAEKMPDVAAALRVMASAHQRLTELGWRDPIYCPKDGAPFEVIEAGSTGIFRCIYRGKWPDGHWWIIEKDGDVSPSRPILFRLYPEDQAKEDERWRKFKERFDSERAGTGDAGQ